uniref:Uncharacterized protein n=1 Tax=Lepeophtheirus salmonis TaxID=72036 RepID=A0A0K2TIF8_LEPSM
MKLAIFVVNLSIWVSLINSQGFLPCETGPQCLKNLLTSSVRYSFQIDKIYDKFSGQTEKIYDEDIKNLRQSLVRKRKEHEEGTKAMRDGFQITKSINSISLE